MADEKFDSEQLGKYLKQIQQLKNELLEVENVEQRLAEVYEERRSDLQGLSAQLEQESIQQRELFSLRNDSVNLIESEIIVRKQIIDGLNDNEEVNKKLVEQNIALLKQSEQKLSVYKKERLEALEAYKVSERMLQGNISLQQTFANLATKLTGVSQNWGGLKGAMMNARKSGMEWNQIGKSITQQFKQQFAAINVANALLDRYIHSTKTFLLEQDLAIASFRRLTGAGKEYDAVLEDAWRNNIKFGVTMQDAAIAGTALYNNLRIFKDLNAETQKSLTATVAKLNKLNVDSQLTTRFMNRMTSAFGHSAEELDVLTNRFVTLSTAVGGPPAKAMQKFMQVSGDLIQHGTKTEQVFTNLMHTANALGVEINDLVSITKKLNTFQGAAETAGNLNAILGGNLVNSVQLLNATENERILILRKTLQASGRAWESMNKFERMALASAAGIQDMNAASQLFGKSQAEFNQAINKSKERAQAQVDYNKLLQESQPIQEKMRIALQTFIIAMRPVIETIKSAVDWFNSLGETSKQIIGWSLILITVIPKLAVAFKLLGGALSMLGFSGGKAAKGAGAMSRMSGGVARLSQSMTPAIPVMYSFGAAILMAGVGVGLAAAGIAMLVVSLGSLFGLVKNNFNKFIKFMVTFGTVIGAVAVSAFVLGTAGPLAFIGLAAMAAGFGLLALSLAVIKTADLRAMATMLESMALIAKHGASDFGKLPATLGNVIEKLEDIGPVDHIYELSNAINSLASAMKRLSESAEATIRATSIIDEKMNQEISTFVNSTERLVRVRAESNVASGVDSFIEKVGSAFDSGPNTAPNNSEGPRTIILKIGEEEFARAIQKYGFQKQNHLSLG